MRGAPSVQFSDIIDRASALLQRKGRISYRALTVEFDLTDDLLDILKEELIDIQEVAADKDGKMLVWAGGETPTEAAPHAADVSASELSAQSPSVYQPVCHWLVQQWRSPGIASSTRCPAFKAIWNTLPCMRGSRAV